MEIVVLECSRCRKRHVSAANMRRHVRTRTCDGAEMIQRRGRVVVVEEQQGGANEATPQFQASTRSKPGPRPLDMSAMLRSRLPAYDEGDDDRIDALFDDAGLLDGLLRLTEINHVAPYLFRVLWGKDAPERFRSFALYCGKLFEVSRRDVVTCRGKFTKNLAREIVCYMLDFAGVVATVSLPARMPGDPRTAHLLRLLETGVAGVTLRDMLLRTDAYRAHRTPGLVVTARAIEDAFLDGCLQTVWTPYTRD